MSHNMLNESSTAELDSLRQTLRAHGQEHLLQFWHELTGEQQQSLATQIRGVDFPLVNQLRQQSTSNTDYATLARRAEPPQAFRLHGSENRFSKEQARVAGEAALLRGEVAAILVAGGQGTRLGFDEPKGMYPIGPVSGATLFQILFEKLLAVARRYKKTVPLYLMTSIATHDDTAKYLREQRNFGLPAEDVTLFCQGTMPAVDAASGRILLSTKDSLALSPDGHGGMLAALAKNGCLDDMQRRGIKHLFYFQVDNPLVVMCDPVFLGYHLLGGSEMSTLAVEKRDARERVGNIVQIDGRTQIIEYSDLPHDVADQKNADGSLKLWAGNTAVHVLGVEFMRQTVGPPEAHPLQWVGLRDQSVAGASSPPLTTLPFHIARKKVPHVNERGELIEPEQPNALKFERFIFDLLPAAQNAIVVETDAATTFAPVKNAPGEQRDSPDTCRAAMLALYRSWLRDAGATVPENVPIEISPLFALDATDVAKKITHGQKFDHPTYLTPDP